MLAYEYAVQNGRTVPESWTKQRRAGHAWWKRFSSQHKLSIRSPEATSPARETAFNRYNVQAFYKNLTEVLDDNTFEATDFFILDETGCTTVQNSPNVVASKGAKQIGSMTLQERGELVTAVYTIRADGYTLPPMLLYPIVNYRDYLIHGSPPRTIGAASRSGWINEELFVRYLEHFVKITRCSKDQKALLILDNHESHCSLSAIDYAKEHGIIMVTLPPHTSPKLQPLDVSVFFPFKNAHNKAIEAHMRSNPAKPLTIYDTAQLVNSAQMAAMTPQNVIAGFLKTGIFPFNDETFSNSDFAPSEVTNRPVDDEVIATTSGQKQNLIDSESPSKSTAVQTPVSPVVLVPFPKAVPRDNEPNKKGRKRGATKILTATPVRDSIAITLEEWKAKKQPKTKSNSVETAQPGDRTTNPDIVMPECYASSQRVDSLARVVITPVHHTHTRLHTPLSNICSSPSSLQHTRGLTSPACLLPQPYPQCSVLGSGLLVLHYR